MSSAFHRNNATGGRMPLRVDKASLAGVPGDTLKGGILLAFDAYLLTEASKMGPLNPFQRDRVIAILIEPPRYTGHPSSERIGLTNISVGEQSFGDEVTFVALSLARQRAGIEEGNLAQSQVAPPGSALLGVASTTSTAEGVFVNVLFADDTAAAGQVTSNGIDWGRDVEPGELPLLYHALTASKGDLLDILGPSGFAHLGDDDDDN